MQLIQKRLDVFEVLGCVWGKVKLCIHGYIVAQEPSLQGKSDVLE